MNKAITDGLVLMPSPFADGLAVWSAGDGTPGSETYATTGNGVFVPADQDFSGCLELLKTQSVTKLRYMGETTLLPGCYLRISTRVKAVSVFSTESLTSLHTKRSEALRIRTPGSSPASVST